MMNLNFNDLSDIVLNEAPISSYINKAKKKLLKARIGARKIGRELIDDPEAVAAKAAKTAAGGVGGALSKVGKAAGTAAGKVASGAKELALNAPGLAAKAVTGVPSAIKSARNLFLGDSPGQTIASGLNKLQGGIDKIRADKTAKSLGMRTENPKTGDNLSIEIGRNPGAGVGIKIPTTGNTGVRFGKSSKFQNMTVYDVPINNNRNISLIKIGVGDPKDSNVQLYYFDKNNQRVDGRIQGLPTAAILNYSNKVNGWKITDKEPPGIEEFSLTKVKIAMQKTQAQQTKGAQPTTTSGTRSMQGVGQVTQGQVISGGLPGAQPPETATTATTPGVIPPIQPAAQKPKVSAIQPKPGDVFNIEDRNGKLKKYQISAIDGDTVYAFQV